MNDEDNLTTTRENTSRGGNREETSPIPMSKGSLLNKETIKSIDMYRSPPSGIPRKSSNQRK